MSPSKTTKIQKSKTLTIEFSGISTLIWNPKAGTAEVRLVDLASAGFQQHYAALGLVVDEHTADAVKGPDADAAVSMPNANMDMGLWNLLGTEVEVFGAAGKLSVDHSKVDTAKKPSKTADSIRWLPDISFLTDSRSLDPICPIATVIRIPAGRVTASASAGSRRMEFLEHGTPVAPPRYYLGRFKVAIPFETELAIRLDRRRVLRFADSRSVMISNTCVCGLGMSVRPNHFFAHYDVTQAKRRPKVEPAGPQPKLPAWPEFCFAAFVEA